MRPMLSSVQRFLQSKKSSNVLLSSSLGSLVIKLCNICIGFITSVMLARSLGASEYGTFAFALSLITVLTIPLQLGMPQLIARDTVKYYSYNERSHIKGLWLFANCSVLLVTVVCFLIYFLWIQDVIHNTYREYFYIINTCLIILPLVAFSNLCSACIKGLQMVIKGQLGENIIRPGLMLLISVGVLWFTPNVTAEYMITSYAIGACGTLTITFFLLKRSTPLVLKLESKRSVEPNLWMKAAIPFMLIAALQTLNSQFDIIVLTFFKSTHEVGVYKAVISISTLVIFGFMAVQVSLTPMVAKLFYEDNIQELQKIVTMASRITLFLGATVVLVVIVYGELILNFLFGAQYVYGYYILVIISLGKLINASFGLSVTLLSMTGNEKSALKTVIVSTIVNISANIILVPIYGIIGAAISTVISAFVWNIYMWYMVKNKIDINTSPF